MPKRKKEVEEDVTDKVEAESVEEESVTAGAEADTDQSETAPEAPEERKASLEAELAANLAEQQQLRSEEAEIRQEIDTLIHYLEGNASPHSNQINIMDYIEKQHRIRMERAGVYVEPVPRRSALDAAMASKRGRGQNRPQYPGSK